MLERELFNQDKQPPKPEKAKKRKKVKVELEEEKEKKTVFPNLPEEIISKLDEAELRGKGKLPSSD